ncbi:tRNA pseudouridine(38-40) synthase TruA [soil metagenome]|jgi:tRNA pseudouridine38-40 synthase
MKLAGLVEYDGEEFAGWAAQPDHRTVEGTLSEALETILQVPVKISVAGRTDAGVHAAGQVISFGADTDLTPHLVAYKTSAVLPKDLAIRRCVEVPEDFDARRDARSRSYEYRIVNSPVRSPLLWRRSLYVARKLDPGLLRAAGEIVLGTHKFRSFTPSRTYHVRFERVITESFWETRDELLTYNITANSFLYGMVRSLVGTMLEVAEGKRTLSDFERLLSDGDRTEAGPAVLARGLNLTNVEYELDLWKEREHG